MVDLGINNVRALEVEEIVQDLVAAAEEVALLVAEVVAVHMAEAAEVAAVHTAVAAEVAAVHMEVAAEVAAVHTAEIDLDQVKGMIVHVQVEQVIVREQVVEVIVHEQVVEAIEEMMGVNVKESFRN